MQKTTALYDRLVAKGALMNQNFGLENAQCFADGPDDAHENAAPGTALQVEILGEMCSAQVLGAPIYDPSGENMRG